MSDKTLAEENGAKESPEMAILGTRGIGATWVSWPYWPPRWPEPGSFRDQRHLARVVSVFLCRLGDNGRKDGLPRARELLHAIPDWSVAPWQERQARQPPDLGAEHLLAEAAVCLGATESWGQVVIPNEMRWAMLDAMGLREPEPPEWVMVGATVVLPDRGPKGATKTIEAMTTGPHGFVVVDGKAEPMGAFCASGRVAIRRDAQGEIQFDSAITIERDGVLIRGDVEMLASEQGKQAGCQRCGNETMIEQWRDETPPPPAGRGGVWATFRCERCGHPHSKQVDPGPSRPYALTWEASYCAPPLNAFTRGGLKTEEQVIAFLTRELSKTLRELEQARRVDHVLTETVALNLSGDPHAQ